VLEVIFNFALIHVLRHFAIHLSKTYVKHLNGVGSSLSFWKAFPFLLSKSFYGIAYVDK
jgi:hypothetical protein